MVEKYSVKFVNAALHEDDRGNIVLRGVVDADSLHLLKVDAYQREVLAPTKINELMHAFENGSAVPDIDLGMRGGGYLEKEGCFYLHDDVFIIDGLQRVTAGRKMQTGGKKIYLGAVVHFNTSYEWEKDRFRVLNTTASKLSPNILLRNSKDESPFIDMLFNLCRDKSFILNGKVCWNQRMSRGELVSALTLVRVTGFLHSRWGAGRSSRYYEIVNGLDKIQAKIGRTSIRDNTKEFWSMMDEAFQVQYVTYRDSAIYLRSGFLSMMASLIGDHANFWDDIKLKINKNFRRKIALFPINDPEVVRLAGNASATSNDILYQLMVKHINSGKRTHVLIPSRTNLKTGEEGAAE